MTDDAHEHEHGPGCGHVGVRHDDHVDHLHDGELHHHGDDGIESHTLAVGDAHPADCTPDHDCDHHEAGHEHGPGCGHEAVPHGDHVDYLVGDHLHHPHRDHCDHHGKVEVVQRA